jgi:hypothetical protein
VQARCNEEGVPFATLRAAAGANLDAAGSACAAVGVQLGAIDDYADCLGRQHACRVAELLRFQAPRADELLSRVGRDLQNDLCPY